jgi:hypothetical protein
MRSRRQTRRQRRGGGVEEELADEVRRLRKDVNALQMLVGPMRTKVNEMPEPHTLRRVAAQFYGATAK